MKNRKLDALILMLFIFAPVVFAGQVDLTTYYPAPYGEYQELRSTGNSYFATASGAVGIGTTTIYNPQGWNKTLDILGAGSARLNVRTAAQGVVTSVFSHSSAWGGPGGLIGTETNHPLKFLTGYTERMRIDTSGNVGIGTASPGSRLHVAGITQITDGSASADTSGYAAFGITRPASNSTLSYFAMTRQGNSVKAMGIDANNRWIFGLPTSSNLTITNPQMVIEHGGNVGIGTAIPRAKLHVVGLPNAILASLSDNFNIDRGWIELWPSGGNAAGPALIGAILPGVMRFGFMPWPGNIAGWVEGMRLQCTTQACTETRVVVTGDLVARRLFSFGMTPRDASQSLNVFLNPDWSLGWDSSLRELKKNITDLPIGLETVKKLRPVSFEWKKDGGQDLGFIAEEIEQVNPLLVTYDPEKKLAGVKYNQLTALLTKAIQEQQEEIKELRARLEQLEAR